MAYKTILVHADKSRRAEELIKVAGNIARFSGAHLVGLAATGLSRFAVPAEADLHDPYLWQHIEFMRRRAHQALDKFETQASQMGLDSVGPRLADDDAGGALA